jgi:hypothetical protein
MIRKTLSPIPKWQFMLFGLSEIFDGLVTVLSLGMLSSRLSMTTISYFTKKHFKSKGKSK